MTLFLEQKYAKALLRIQELEQQIAFMTGTSSEQLELSYDQKMKIEKYITERKVATNLPPFYWLPIPHFKFITITFDPAKFGLNNEPSKEKNYILWHLTRIRKYGWCTCFSGCFEKQQNGTIHAHLIMGTNYQTDVYKYLHKQFTDNPRNKVAIRIDPAKIRAMEYIRKESDHYFQSKFQPFNDIKTMEQYEQIKQQYTEKFIPINEQLYTMSQLE